MGSKCSKSKLKPKLEDIKSGSFIERSNLGENSMKDSIVQLAGDDSLLTYEKLIAIFPENPELLLKFANSLYEKGMIPQSSECYEKVISQGFPLDSISSLLYSRIQVQNKNYEIAIEILLKSLETSQRDHESHAFLSEIYSMLEVHEKSLKHILEALKINDTVGDYHNSYGLCLMKENEYSEALKHFLIAYELDPHMAKALNNAGNAHRKLGNTAEAITCYNAAINSVPKRMFPIALINLATAHFYTGDILSTLEYFEEALQTGSNIHKIMIKKGYYLLFKSPRTRIAIELLVKQELMKSLMHFSEILQADPENPIVNYYMGLNLEKLARISEANDRFKIAIE